MGSNIPATVGIYNAVAHFNIGGTAAIEILREQGCTQGISLKCV